MKFWRLIFNKLNETNKDNNIISNDNQEQSQNEMVDNKQPDEQNIVQDSNINDNSQDQNNNTSDNSQKEDSNTNPNNMDNIPSISMIPIPNFINEDNNQMNNEVNSSSNQTEQNSINQNSSDKNQSNLNDNLSNLQNEQNDNDQDKNDNQNKIKDNSNNENVDNVEDAETPDLDNLNNDNNLEDNQSKEKNGHDQISNQDTQNIDANSNNSQKENKDKTPDKQDNIEEDFNNSEKDKNKVTVDKNTNTEFLNELKSIPSFENRDRGDGYSFNLENSEEVSERIIKVLLTKFLNQRFCKKDTDLNTRSNSLDKKDGFYKWDVKKVVIHLETEQYVKVIQDKTGYTYAEGKNENIPLSFYFDLSGSMSNYSGTLATMAIELLKKNVKVLVGFNQLVNVQIDSINNKVNENDLASFLSIAGNLNSQPNKDSYPEIKFKLINKNIDKFLIDAHAEKTVIFSDFDPRSEIINLSEYCKTYWFCFENGYGSRDISGFKGFSYSVKNLDDIAQGLIKVNEKRFEALTYINNVKKKVRK